MRLVKHMDKIVLDWYQYEISKLLNTIIVTFNDKNYNRFENPRLSLSKNNSIIIKRENRQDKRFCNTFGVDLDITMFDHLIIKVLDESVFYYQEKQIDSQDKVYLLDFYKIEYETQLIIDGMSFTTTIDCYINYCNLVHYYVNSIK